MTNPSQEAVVEAFDVFLDQYTGKHDKDNWLKNTLYADTVQVRKDLIIKQFREVLTTFAQTIREMERDRIIQIANKEAVSVDDCRNIVVIPKHKFFMAITPITKDNLK